jgi:hypothetical protein
MPNFLAIAAGIALAAACGFRVFLPLLAASLAAKFDYIDPSSSFEWIESGPAIILFSVATAFELAAYYIPWLDHALDTIASPAAVAAGTVAAGAVLPFGDQLHPAVHWAAALVAGGGAAGAVQAGTVGLRAASGATTGTLGNPVVATIENVLSTVLSVLAIVVPILAAVLVLIAFAWAAKLIARWRRRRHSAAAATVVATQGDAGGATG